MTEESPNDQFHASSFLQGHNAEYVEALHARYADDPSAVDDAWQRFFRQLGDASGDAKAEATGPSWARADWPPAASDEVTAALDGQWGSLGAPEAKAAGDKIKSKAAEKGVEISEGMVRRAVTDSLRALMLIRAYRIRGHLIADLDPLGMRDQTEHPELSPASYGFTAADMDRPIFIDNVLGLEVATLSEILALVKRTYCGTFALQYMHISDPDEAGWLKERIEGFGKEISFHRKRPPRDPEQAGRGRRLREIPARQIHGHQAVRSGRRRKPDPGDGTDHQARWRIGRRGDRDRHAAPGPPSACSPTSCRNPTARSSTSFRAAVSSQKTSMVRAM